MSDSQNPENNHQTDPHADPNPWQKKEVPLQDVVISNSWALQSILEYLDEQNPGARDRIWNIYQSMQQQAQQAQQSQNDTAPESNIENDASES